MLKRIKNSLFLKNTFIYTFLQIFNKGVSFLLLPILTYYLSPIDYGIISNFNVLLGVFAIFISISVPGAITINFFKLRNNEQIAYYLGNSFIVLFINFIVVCSLVFFFKKLNMINIKFTYFWISIILITAFFEILSQIFLIIFRNLEKAKIFAIFEISKTLLNIFITLILVIYFNLHWVGRVSGIIFANILFGVISLYILYKINFFKIKIMKKYIIDIYKFGLSLLPHNIALWLRTSIDIILITNLINVSSAGIYSFGYTFGAMIGIIAHSFNNAFVPYLYKKLEEKNFNENLKIIKITYLYFILILIFAILYSLLLYFSFPYFINSNFLESRNIIIWIALAYAFNGMYLMVVNYIFYEKKTFYISVTTIIMSLLQVLISYLFIKEFGIIGAAYANVIVYLFTFLIIWKISTKVYSMPWSYFFTKVKN